VSESKVKKKRNLCYKPSAANTSNKKQIIVCEGRHKFYHFIVVNMHQTTDGITTDAFHNTLTTPSENTLFAKCSGHIVVDWVDIATAIDVRIPCEKTPPKKIVVRFVRLRCSSSCLHDVAVVAAVAAVVAAASTTHPPAMDDDRA
jgi:hypothetical protein